jgi:anti-sigma28 factor (negative regulator of flagellin synthesis)
MKIRNDTQILENQQLLTESLKKHSKGAKGASTNGAGTEQDSVSLPLGRAVQETLEALSSRSDRQARVAEIKQLIQKGGVAEYFKQVPTDKVAKSFLEEVSFEIATGKETSPEGEE